MTAVIFVVGLSGAFIQIGSVKLTGMALATVVGVVLGCIFALIDKLGLANDVEKDSDK